jgi:hypothetical protein
MRVHGFSYLGWVEVATTVQLERLRSDGHGLEVSPNRVGFDSSLRTLGERRITGLQCRAEVV